MLGFSQLDPPFSIRLVDTRDEVSTFLNFCMLMIYLAFCNINLTLYEYSQSVYKFGISSQLLLVSCYLLIVVNSVQEQVFGCSFLSFVDTSTQD